jgi:hypothetical protein
VPAADARFLVGLHQRHGRAGEGDAPVLAEVDLVLDPGAPVADELGLVEKQVLGAIGRGSRSRQASSTASMPASFRMGWSKVA